MFHEFIFPSQSGFFLILVPGFLYLATVSPTIDHGDSPEFADTAFTLGISHPAGFPTYNLLVKAITFVPLGSIAFRVNLASAIFACLTLVCLYWTGFLILRLLYPGADEAGFFWPSILPAGFLAVSFPFWLHSLIAEVYTLHAFFVCVMILLMVLWKQKVDVRYLYAMALVFGLSAGNHATVALFLPAVLALFFFWNREYKARNLSVSIIFFLVGFSVYAYLPIRSMAEPSFDWGNPETVEGFLYQVTDRKDAETHFSYFREDRQPADDSFSPGEWLTSKLIHTSHLAWRVCKDLTIHLSLVSVAGLLAGGFFCFKRNLPLFSFFLLLAGFNVAFFATWQKESFFPTYIVVSLLTTIYSTGCF